MKLWIVITDGARARIFSCAGRGQPLSEVAGLIHPRSLAKGHEILADRPGRIRAGLKGCAVTAMPPHTDPRDVEAERFARDVARALRDGRERGAFEHLGLIAPPRFLGRLRDHLDARVRDRVVASVAKDLAHVAPSGLPPHLSEVFDGAEHAALAAGSGEAR